MKNQIQREYTGPTGPDGIGADGGARRMQRKKEDMTMLHRKKRLCALLLAGVMLLTQLPITALAAEQTPPDQTVTDWTFEGDDNLNEGELTLISVGAQQQADFDSVVSMLPTGILAEINEGTEPVPVDITVWSCPEYKQDAQGYWPLSGTYTFTAALPQGYACDPLPTVKVTLGGAGLLAGTSPTIGGGLTIEVSDGGVADYVEGDGFTLQASGTYVISGTWIGTLDDVGLGNQKSVITVTSGAVANITLKDLSIDIHKSNGYNLDNYAYACAFEVEPSGTANIILSGESELVSGFRRAGLEVPDGAEVSINGGNTDKLIAYSRTDKYAAQGAGIGGGCNKNKVNGGNGGNIAIIGGTVTATSDCGAGIGGSAGLDNYNGGSGGSIVIDSGTVTATSGAGAGIGGGGGGEYTISKGPSCEIVIVNNRCSGGGSGNIAIKGGAVTAISSQGPGIGGGISATDGGAGEKFTIE